MNKPPLDKYTGCLIGGAIGDALGAPIEFMDLQKIKSTYGKKGVVDYIEYENRVGEFTDDTQMILFTAEGILRAYNRRIHRGIDGALIPIIRKSYLRWLETQGIKYHSSDRLQLNGWLVQQKELHKQRAPGNTCINSLASGEFGTIDNPINDSKGCGTVMRVAPVGLFYNDDSDFAFKIACEISALTHGHPSGYLSAGFLAALIAELSHGNDLLASINKCTYILQKWIGHEETLCAVQKSVELYKRLKRKRKIDPEYLEKLGQGWIAEEALSISLLCSLLYENDFEKGVLLSINHSGDSDSTGAITGNILGVINGESKIPFNWIVKLKYSNLVIEVAEDLHTCIKGNINEPNEDWWEKYPRD